MDSERLDGEARTVALARLGPGWTVIEGREAIARTFVFANFNAAFGWMSRVAMAAEKAGHHPEWTNVYKTVAVVLTTHSAGGLTDKDIRLARSMDRYAAEAGLKG